MKRIILMIIGVIVAGIAMGQVNGSFKSVRIMNSDSTHGVIPGTIYRGSDLILRWVDDAGVAHRFVNGSSGSFWKTAGTSTFTNDVLINGGSKQLSFDAVSSLTASIGDGGILLESPTSDIGLTAGINMNIQGGDMNISAVTPGGNIQLNSPNSGITIDNTISISPSTFLDLSLPSSATGDTYYRNSSGHFTRLPIGSSGQALRVSGGIPAWQSITSLSDYWKTTGTSNFTGATSIDGDGNNLTFSDISTWQNTANTYTLTTATGNMTFTSALSMIFASNAGNISFSPSNFLNINLGSDATGDIFYRNSGGHFTRLPIGSSGNVLTVSAGIPAWQTPSTSLGAYWKTTGTSTLTGTTSIDGNTQILVMSNLGVFQLTSSEPSILGVGGSAFSINSAGGVLIQSGTSQNITIDPNGGYIKMNGLPTSCAGAPTGALANISGVLNICP